MLMATTGVLWDARYLDHVTGPWHPERPERLAAIRRVLTETETGRRCVSIEPRFAAIEEIALVHDFEYVRKIEKTAGLDIELDPDTPVSPGSWDAARLAVGGMLNAVDAVFEGKVDNAFAFVRPPGHHAEKARAMGFCLFNNVAIAAEYAIRTKGCRRVAIVDFDVHHGNGTQWAFYDRSDVFFLSTHRYPFYPGTGSRREEGEGKGRGYTLNVTFGGGEGDHEYLKAFDDLLIPSLGDYSPDFVLVSAGYDAHRLDPIGGMNVTDEGFGRMSEAILQVAEKACSGRSVFVLEGGYSLEGLAGSVEATLRAMGPGQRPLL
jgi:acetoin utilization deacetylase AcuC-like enzyme